MQRRAGALVVMGAHIPVSLDPPPGDPAETEPVAKLQVLRRPERRNDVDPPAVRPVVPDDSRLGLEPDPGDGRLLLPGELTRPVGPVAGAGHQRISRSSSSDSRSSSGRTASYSDRFRRKATIGVSV